MANNVITMIRDGFANFATRVGTRGDKSTASTWFFVPMSQEELNAAYSTSWIRKIVDIPAIDMTAEWIEWQSANADIEDIEAEQNRLQIQIKTADAIRKARLYGWSVMVMGIKGQDATQPLALDSVGLGMLEFVHVASKYDITAGQLDRNPLSPTYGDPISYSFNTQGGQMMVHPSRVIRFVGLPNPDPFMSSSLGDSVADLVRDRVRDVDSVAGNIAALVNESKVDVYSIPGLMEMMATKEYEDRLTKRVSIANSIKSSLNAILVDAGNSEGKGGETWEQKQVTFAGLPDIATTLLNLMAGMSDIPVTRLLGTSARGMNATGEGDERNYLKMISSKQKMELRPCLEKLNEVLIRSATGSRDPSTYFTFAELWSPSALDASTIEKTEDEAAQLVANMNVMPEMAFAKAMQNRLIESGRWPGLEAALEEFGDEPEQADPITLGIDPMTGNPIAANANSPIGKAANDATMFMDGIPKTLYVRRDVTNASSIAAWAKAQGLTFITDPHVTITYSKTPVDWMKISQPWDSKLEVPAGGPRDMALFGDNALVLLFNCSELEWRHTAMLEAGATSDYPNYQPHITITYAPPAGLDLTKITPYRGVIELGPEIFEVVNDDYKSGIVEE